MGSPMGKTIDAKATVGQQGQQQFTGALQNATIGPNGQFQGVNAYGGQLTPNLQSSLANNVWNSWGANAPGMNQTQNAMNGLQGQQGMSQMMIGQAGGMMGGYNPNAGQPMQSLNRLGGPANMPGPNAQGFGGFNANNANMNSPWMSNMLPGAGGGSFSPNGYNMANGSGAGSLLAANAMGYGAGASVDSTPAWQAMVGAQQQNLQTGADQLAEQFNNGGGLFSSAYGNAQGQYQSNARAQQNSQLSQAQLQSMLAAQGVQANAAGQLGQNQLGWGQNQLGWGQNQTANSGLQLQGAMNQNNMWNNNMNLGMNLGNQQYGMQQNALTADYQNWFASQAYNNPLLSMMYSQANSYAPPPTQTQGWLAPVLSAAGGVMGGVGGLMSGAAALRK